ncbi:MAG: polysaccharide deacetylase family protein [Defluviitaleaceae bacterium]|nr:polysaccharide deacetylase family protein [Defluviitaleaceae bacterium]
MKRFFCSAFLVLCAILLAAQITIAAPLESLYGAKQGEEVIVPIIMYHALEDNPSNRWEITEEEFEADLHHLQSLGYNTVVMQDLIDFVNLGKPLPEKPIVLSFDDGRQPALDILLTLLEKFDANVTMAIIGAQTDKYTKISSEQKDQSFPHMTWADVEKATNSGRIEISCHSYDLHGGAGVGKKGSETESSYRTRLLADLQLFANVLHQNAGLTANSFVYPLGIFSELSDEIIKSAGYLTTLTCSERHNTITFGDPSSLFKLGRYNRPPHKSSEAFFNAIGIH